jgi:O-6-methylguanine DNA methyltransferase
MKLSNQDVYNYLLLIPYGKVVTYGQIAEYLGNKNYARTVGNILHVNPDGNKYPCYKVVNSKGYLSEHYAFGGVNGQMQRLLNEGINVKNNRVELSKYLWNGLN